MKMLDSVPLLFTLDLLNHSEFETNEFLDGNDDIIYFSAVSSYLRRKLNRVRDYFEITIWSYIPQRIFSGRVQEQLPHDKRSMRAVAQADMPTGRIHFGDISGRPCIPPSNQVLAFLWSMANQEPERVADRFDITLSSVNRVLQRVSQAAIDLSGCARTFCHKYGATN